MVNEFKNKMMNVYGMTNLGPMRYFLGIQVSKVWGKSLFLKTMLMEILKRFDMSQYKTVCIPVGLNEKFQGHDDAKKFDARLYINLIGSLIYLNTSPDITYSGSLLSRFLNEPSNLAKTNFEIFEV